MASKWLTEKWKIWVASNTVGVAEWITLPHSHWALGTQPLLAADIWYQFTLEMDYDILEYVSLTIQDETNGVVLDVANLTGIVIAKEPRAWESATVVCFYLTAGYSLLLQTIHGVHLHNVIVVNANALLNPLLYVYIRVV